MGATSAVTMAAVVVELVFGVRQAVAKMEVGIAFKLCIRVTEALEAVKVASLILGALATASIAVV